jgi:sodium-dependent dicarboxylate transporter 2/3/5
MARMQANQSSSGNRREWPLRFGFWLGLVLFVLLLLVRPPASMHVAAREHFADKLPADIASILKSGGIGMAEPDSLEYRQAEERAVAARARIMMGAAAMTALVGCWWIFVAIPIPATSLLPLLLLPVLGILPIRAAAAPYADPYVFLLVGGMIIALGIERWGLHRRIALHTVRIIGTGRATIVLGFMVASAVLSMWIANTASTLMLLPIALAVVSALSELGDETSEKSRANFAAALMLGIAYSANVGGIGTPIGTPPNLVFKGQIERLFPDAPEISFGYWMLLFVPLIVVFVPAIWLVLTRVTCRFDAGGFQAGREVIRAQLAKLGPRRGPETAMLIIFGITALLWMTRSIPIGDDANYGWAWLIESWLSAGDGAPHRFQAGHIHDTSVALAMAMLTFIIPAGRDASGRRQFLMNWETTQRLPWGILLLFGGGFAIAAGFQASGLSLWCGRAFAGLNISNPFVLTIGTCLMITFLTEITSNTATTQVMLPILARVSLAMGVNPLLMMLPATASASCAFMLPVATPPNAIVFGSGKVSMGQMVRTGIILNLIGVVLVTLVIYLVAKPLLGISLDTLPPWAG